jgi:hypothetical protein
VDGSSWFFSSSLSHLVPMGFGLPNSHLGVEAKAHQSSPQIFLKKLLAPSTHQSNGKKSKARRSTRGNWNKWSPAYQSSYVARGA